jgi:chromosome segregation protein
MTDDETLFRAPRLTRLEIQGFKSFLNRTIFAFEPGITGIVGPNGSGKSNVADAVRWVLGEQGQHALRAKKTEDVIFSGGHGRAPAGMAEATLTFDNADGWLPIEFAEVSVTRRAFRSGESQYLINGRRVRLKDVALLTAGLGQSHVVVGQGLVDAALSLRAEERRGLFEHAADLAGLRLKVAEAERNLAETDANTARLSDLLIELEPRLRSLERAARQAKEWQSIRDRLRALQGAHYREALEAAIAALAAAESGAEQAAQAVAVAHEDVVRLTAAGELATTRLTAARERLARHDERRAALEDRLRRQTHERDLAAARFEALSKRRADMDDAREGLDERVASVVAELVKLQSDLRDLERATTESRDAAARHARDVTARREARAAIETRLAAASRDLAESERLSGELTRERAVLGERGESLSAEHERLRGAIDERGRRIEAVEADAARADTAAQADAERTAALNARLAELANDLETATRLATSTRADVDRMHGALGEASTRLEILRRMRESGADLDPGVRAALAAGRDGRLEGIRGTVAELLVVPESLEVAIEAALGHRLQDIVVAAWSHAEAAISHLKQSGAGRATFHPLDTISGCRAGTCESGSEELPGILGVAADLVSAPAEIGPVVVALLGRTLVADDLVTARAAFQHLPPGWSVVTITGEIAHTGGAVTGGSAVQESVMLGWERELRELPDEIMVIERDLAAARDRAEQADAAVRAMLDARRHAEDERAALGAAAHERRQQRQRLTDWLTELRREQEQSRRRWEELDSQRSRVTASRDELDRESNRLDATRKQVARVRDESAAELSALMAATADVERVAAEEGRRLAGLEERLRGERRREAGLKSQERALAEELALRTERGAALDREREALTADHARLSSDVAASIAALETATDEREPLRIEAMGAEIAATRLAEALTTARAAVVERDRERDHAEFALERSQQELDILRDRIADDLDLADPDEVLTCPPGAITTGPADREAEIARLRERLRRVGYVGEDAVADYERENAQQAYLREQLADVEGAAAALRDLLADLRRTMRARFDETFAMVAAAFAEAFANLFGGGTAQLVLTTGDYGAEPGIDIIAQPPGKRLQSLALLSGGERALTAAALLFAILKVNPVPFCLLDEVDAALDEANVVRFRERLRELAAQSQVIVVTHNRGTIEIADTLYGVSMGADGVSQVLSLRLSEASLPAD